MIVIFAALFGILLGFRTAKRKGGNRADILQYVAAYGMGCAVLGVIVTVTIERLI